jgi:uncharacterized membrane protein YqiK
MNNKTKTAKKAEDKKAETVSVSEAVEAEKTEAAEVESNMTEEVKAEEATAKAEAAAVSERAIDESEAYVYCAPSVKGVARQFTIFTGERPEYLKRFVEEHPIANALIVPVSEFAETRRKLEIKDSPEAILYKQIKSEI